MAELELKKVCLILSPSYYSTFQLIFYVHLVLLLLFVRYFYQSHNMYHVMFSLGVGEEKGEKTKRANQTFQETGGNAASSEGKGG